MASYMEEAVAECRRQIGDGRVLLALSGGVDSAPWPLRCCSAPWAIS